MKFKNNWEETKERFSSWWRRGNKGRPLLHLVGLKQAPSSPVFSGSPADPVEDRYLNADRIVGNYLDWCSTVEFLGESYPNVGLDLGPGSLALYLGSDPVFTPETVWFRECVKTSWESFGDLRFDPENRWWKIHYGMIRKAREIAGEDILVNVPDLVENVDILAALRGPQRFCYDLIDEPALMKRLVGQVDDLYFKYFDAYHDLVVNGEGLQGFAAFRIFGEGKTAKIQCDFSALMSPAQFDDFVVPSLTRQCAGLDFSMYHLDGPDALKHADSVLAIRDLDVLQWSPGAGQPDGDSEKWFPLYDKVKRAGKGLWIGIGETDPGRLASGIDSVVRRFGTAGLFLFLPDLPLADAEKLLSIVEKRYGS